MGHGRATHEVVAALVYVVLQMAAAVVGGQDGTQLPVACEVEAIVRGEHQQPSDVAPADFLLGRWQGDGPQFPQQAEGGGAASGPVPCLRPAPGSSGEQEDAETGPQLGPAAGLGSPCPVGTPAAWPAQEAPTHTAGWRG